ncbi:bifunctional tRNA (5-methylaminomethyl-2-thiouridine)(34)-methyltransferase MnmD/FAD-dependent 5-carboxymethylaminomethyl-2-thiouridine(34) oxidoreductase MnmC [Gilvimarinus sp. F26214L]|uniref:bifunctional tRNA (5-methylaminomethyl-2-thiouridine)(34)-methyltransferase MnmD/FAD-dependent 5-carboxymethylaminomethyl-2-thiouridine(34) oxidoreductase MnmC n=1 Tax=Gilvimarinus sp. DZF01 TaxID=3461371 RepID=UPI004045EE54
MSTPLNPPPAELDWSDDGQPVSTQHDDVYFSRHNGLEETRYVFLQQNRLQERWQEEPSRSTFFIGETGFGSGLNFLAAWQLWEQCAPPDRQLHFVSVENQPLLRRDLARALAMWPELAQYRTRLLELYPERLLTGFHPFSFSGGRVKLTLIVADAANGLQQLLASDHPLHRKPFHRGMDAWFLDGFAPARNPRMWTPELFEALASLSHSETSLATFTAAGVVRRGLAEAGFQVEKRPGFGHKREMIAARFTGRPQPDPADFPTECRKSPYPAPWHVSPRRTSEARAAVIGAGLAGSHTARALADRGWEVTVFESSREVATGASGNAQGVVYGKLSTDRDGLALFNLASLLFAQRFYSNYWREAHDPAFGEQCGLLQLAYNERQTRIQGGLRRVFADSDDFLCFLSPREASEKAGVALDHSALFFPYLGWLSPPLLCRELVDHPRVAVYFGQQVERLHREDSGWRLQSACGEDLGQFPNVVIANAHNARHLPPMAHLPLKPIRGQVSCFDGEALPVRTVLCGEGYLAPAMRDEQRTLQSFGATFTLRETRADVLTADHEKNLATLTTSLPRFADTLRAIDPATLTGRTGFRCTTPDYLPLVGPAPDFAAFAERYRALRHNARAGIVDSGAYYPGLYLNVGHGSRGLAYTPLAAATLAAQMSGDLLPLSRDLATALNPARFIIRDLIRNRLAP